MQVIKKFLSPILCQDNMEKYSIEVANLDIENREVRKPGSRDARKPGSRDARKPFF
jgi:hypothetical protein